MLHPSSSGTTRSLISVPVEWRSRWVEVAQSGNVERRSTVKPYYGGLAPRVGLAYHITDKLVFRSGYGVFYENYDRRGNLADLALNPPCYTDHEVTSSVSVGPPFLFQNGFGSNWLTPVDITNPRAISRIASWLG